MSWADFSNDLWKHFIEVASRCADKEVADLTAEERGALAILAGVPMKEQDMRTADANTFRLETVPFAIFKDEDGKFHVVHEERHDYSNN